MSEVEHVAPVGIILNSLPAIAPCASSRHVHNRPDVLQGQMVHGEDRAAFNRPDTRITFGDRLRQRPVAPQPTRLVKRYRTKLHNSIIASDWGAVLSHLRTHPGEASICDANGATPLSYAISVEAPIPIIRRLLEADNGEALLRYDDSGLLPIHAACRTKTSIGFLGALLEHWPGMVMVTTLPRAMLEEGRNKRRKGTKWMAAAACSFADEEAAFETRRLRWGRQPSFSSDRESISSRSTVCSDSTISTTLSCTSDGWSCLSNRSDPLQALCFASSCSGPNIRRATGIDNSYTAFDWAWSEHDARKLFLQDRDGYDGHAAANSVRDLWNRLSLLLLAAYRHIESQGNIERSEKREMCPDPLCSLPQPPHWTLSPGDKYYRCTYRALHAAISVPCVPIEIVKFVLRSFPGEACTRDEHGLLPLHLVAAGVCAPRKRGWSSASSGRMMLPLILKANPEAARAVDNRGRLPLFLALEAGHRFHARARYSMDCFGTEETMETYEGQSRLGCNMNNNTPYVGVLDTGVRALLDAYPEALHQRDPVTGLFPVMIAAASSSKGGTSSDVDRLIELNTIFELLVKDCSVIKC